MVFKAALIVLIIIYKNGGETPSKVNFNSKEKSYVSFDVPLSSGEFSLKPSELAHQKANGLSWPYFFIL